MSAMLDTIVSLNELDDAYRGSWCTLIGVDDPQEWVDGLEEKMELHGMASPDKWFQTTGEVVNAFAGNIDEDDKWADDLKFLMFDISGYRMDMDKLLTFRLTWGARWFDDVIDNMRD